LELSKFQIFRKIFLGGPARRLKDRVRIWNVNDFKLGSALGKGKFGNVYVAREKTSGVNVALKVMFKSLLAPDAKRTLLLRREIEIHSRLVHKHVLRCFGYFQDAKHIYIILQYCANGTSLSKMPFEESETKKITKQLSSALEFCHSRGVIHRDLKPENILIDVKGNTVLSDFGWSCHVVGSEKRNTYCGTPDYMSPEQISGKPYDASVDIWALGVTVFEFLTGETPFSRETIEDTFECILDGSFSFPKKNKISNQAKHFIRSLLTYNPDGRPLSSDVSSNIWVLSSFS